MALKQPSSSHFENLAAHIELYFPPPFHLNHRKQNLFTGKDTAEIFVERFVTDNNQILFFKGILRSANIWVYRKLADSVLSLNDQQVVSAQE